MQDKSLHDATIPIDNAEDNMVEYYMVDFGTERGKRKLVDSTGSSYTVKKQKNDHVATRGLVPFYHLVIVLHREETGITVQMKMVSEGKIQRYQRKRTLQVEGRVFQLWNAYCERSISASDLLRGCASVYGPPVM